MSDENSFVVAAYLLTVVVVGAYAGVLLLRARSAERRLAAVREEEARVRSSDPATSRAEGAIGGAVRPAFARTSPATASAAHTHPKLEEAGGSHVQA